MTYTICCVYSEKLLTMDRGTVRNMQSFIPKINLENQCIQLVLLQESITLLSKYKSYCSTARFRRITSIYQPTNVHMISHKTLLKHFKTLRHVSTLSDHHQGALFLAKVILQYSQFNLQLQTRCCGSISCCVVEQWLGVRRTTHTQALLHNTFPHMICCHNTSFANTN